MNAASFPSCAVIIVAYNNADGIQSCLASVFERSSIPTAVVVVDNSPGPDTAQAIAEYAAAHPERNLTLIRRPENLGFAAGCNLGAKGRTEDYFLFLNPDTELGNDVSALLISFLQEKPHAGVAGPQIRDEKAQIARTCRNFPTPWRIFCDATGLDSLLGCYKLLRFGHTETRAVDQVIGAAMMMKRELFENLGGFDERFFIYFEEVDFCKRVWGAGAEVWFYPIPRVIHQAGSSCEAPAMINRMPGFLRRSRAQYFAKHFGILPQFITLGVTIGEAAAKAAILGLMSWLKPKQGGYYRAKGRGFWAFLRQWRGEG